MLNGSAIAACSARRALPGLCSFECYAVSPCLTYRLAGPGLYTASCNWSDPRVAQSITLPYTHAIHRVYRFETRRSAERRGHHSSWVLLGLHAAASLGAATEPALRPTASMHRSCTHTSMTALNVSVPATRKADVKTRMREFECGIVIDVRWP